MFFSALSKKDFITPLISALLTRFPDYQLEIRMFSLAESIEQLISGNSDIVFTNIESNDSFEEYERIVFKQYPAEIIVAPGHPWWNKETITVEEMNQMDLVKIEGGLRLSENLDSQNVYYDIPCRKCIYVPNFTTMYTILEQGKVFAVLPNDFSNVDQLDFHLLPLPYQSGTFDMAALYQKDNRKPALSQVIHFLKEEWQY